MRIIAAIALATSLAASPAVLAQDNLIVVDLTGISLDLATELGVDADDLPDSIAVSAALAAEVCDVEVSSLVDSCFAVTTSTDLLVVVEEEVEGPGQGSDNSAREFAPGQQDGPAKDFAPGQQEGDAKDHAPGQMKKDGDN